MAKKKTFSEEEKKNGLKALILFGGIALALFAIDIITKWVVQLNCAPGEAIAVIPNFFYINLSYNTGAAFSMGANWGIGGRILGIAISVILSTVIIGYWVKNNITFSNFQRAIAALLAAGAVGNLIDRCFYFEGIVGFNGVIDFFQFYLLGGPESGINNFLNPFATFNFADACLVIGVILFIIDTIVVLVRESKNNKLRNDPRLKESVTVSKVDKLESKPEGAKEPVKEAKNKPKEEDEDDEEDEDE